MKSFFKGNLIYKEISFIEKISEMGRNFFAEHFLVGDREELESYKSLGFTIYHDIFKSSGPLGGIYTSLENASCENVLICPCDTPLITLKELSVLSATHLEFENELTVPFVKDRSFPLPGIYSKSLLPSVLRILQGQKKALHLLFRENKTMMVYFEDEIPFSNINSEGDYKSLFLKTP